MVKLSQEVQIVLGVVAAAVVLGLASIGLTMDANLKVGNKSARTLVPLVAKDLVPLVLFTSVVALLVMKR
tara:strand:- start:31334 stop:31543 length:210 start_codon:yes stop_codon:yes gene_type:complete